MITKANARTQVANFLDDNDANNPDVRWSVAEIEQALQFSQTEIVLECLNNRFNSIYQTSNLCPCLRRHN